MTIEPAKISFTPKFISPNIVNEDMNPAKIAKPPSLGVNDSCIVLILGSSKSFFIWATCIIEGIANTDIKNAQAKAKIRLNKWGDSILFNFAQFSSKNCE